MILDDSGQRQPKEPAKRAVALLGAAGATLLVGLLAFYLGAWGFGFQRFSRHEGRLRRLLALQPHLEQVVQALNDEGSPLEAAPESRAELRRIVKERGGNKAEEILEKGDRWPKTRVFVAGDMVYFLFFDGEGLMRDFTCVSR